jgi:hypothetical protein
MKDVIDMEEVDGVWVQKKPRSADPVREEAYRKFFSRVIHSSLATKLYKQNDKETP